MKGIKRFKGSPVSSRLPIIDSITAVIRQALNVTSPNHCMFWEACTLCYFGFLRSAEFTVPNLASFSSTIHLSVADIAVDSSLAPSCLRVRIKASKEIPFARIVSYALVVETYLCVPFMRCWLIFVTSKAIPLAHCSSCRMDNRCLVLY